MYIIEFKDGYLRDLRDNKIIKTDNKSDAKTFKIKNWAKLTLKDIRKINPTVKAKISKLERL